jgi:hypothetical protein
VRMTLVRRIRPLILYISRHDDDVEDFQSLDVDVRIHISDTAR